MWLLQSPPSLPTSHSLYQTQGPFYVILERHRVGRESVTELHRTCKTLCSNLIELLSALVFEKEAQQTTVGASKATVGLMLDGCAIDNVLIGGPAHSSGALRKGDIIVAVDKNLVSKDNVLASIVGSDTPGSSVILTLKEGGSSEHVFSVELVRKATKEIADRRRLFELFTALKAKSKPHSISDQNEPGSPSCTSSSLSSTRRTALIAAEDGFNNAMLGAFGGRGKEFDFPSAAGPRRLTADKSKEYGQLVDETVALWSKMALEQDCFLARIFENGKNTQTNGLEVLNHLQDKLDSLLKLALSCMSNSTQSGLESEELQNQLTEKQRKRIKELENQLAETQRKRITHLTRKVIGVFMHRELKKAMGKWWGEVLRTRKAAKAAKVWISRGMRRAWNAWEAMVTEQNRLRSIVMKVAFRWLGGVSNFPFPYDSAA